MDKRGRPREFDPQVALHKAMQVFWRQGYSATSLDDLSAAMSMNRPSIYNAFGSKRNIYRQTLNAFCGQLDAGIDACLNNNESFETGLKSFFDSAIDLYCSEDPPMGCLMICTAPSEALNDNDIKKDFANLIERIDRAFENRIKKAIKDGEIQDDVNARLLAKCLQSTLHGVALRARAGESKRQLKQYVRFAVDSLPWC